MAREYDIEVEYVYFPLHPETPAEGQSLLELFGGPSAMPRLRASAERLGQIAASEGLPYNKERLMTYNSRDAQELALLADSKGKGVAFHDAVFRAYFVDGANISERATLLELAVAAGLDRGEAVETLEKRTLARELDLLWARTREKGITGVPTFEAGGAMVVGAQPYEVLAKLVRDAGAKAR